MMKLLLIAAGAACLLGGCAQNPNTSGQQLAREDREEPTGSMLPRRRGSGGGNTQVINKDQIDPNQILNPGATQPRIKQ